MGLNQKDKELIKKHPLDVNNCKKQYNPKNASELTLNEWVIINNSNIGIVFAKRLETAVIVRSCRVYSQDISEYDYTEFDIWREEIGNLGGQ